MMHVLSFEMVDWAEPADPGGMPQLSPWTGEGEVGPPPKGRWELAEGRTKAGAAVLSVTMGAALPVPHSWATLEPETRVS